MRGSGSSKQSTDDFSNALAASVPEAQPLIDDNVDDEGLIVHQLMFELRLLAATAFASNNSDLADRVLATVNAAWIDGDDHLRNAVALSFIDAPDPLAWESGDFLATWPQPLMEEYRRQVTWS